MDLSLRALLISPPALLKQFARWTICTPLGRHLIRAEQAWFDKMSPEIRGAKALQLALSHVDFLQASRIPYRYRATGFSDDRSKALSQQLSILTQSLDVLILPHILEFSESPQALLHEAKRVLSPGGRLLITGFNPSSLWVYRHLFKRDNWRYNQLSLSQLKDWLSLVGFESMQGQYVGYTLPLQNATWLAHSQWIEKMGDRWWPTAGWAYCLDMIKR